ncbi:MAG TPA: TolC family protein [Kofleriaceae bacterium]|nr:TolC family protein [Kofleriaceae bacterium]
MFRLGALAGALFLASTSLASADRTLTLEEALSIARAHNRDLRGARERIAIANEAVAQARGALLPTVGVDGRYTHNYKEVDFDFQELLAPTFGVANAISSTTTNAAEAAALQDAVAKTQAEFANVPVVVITKKEELDGSINASVPLIAPSAYYGIAAANRGLDATQAQYQVTEAGVLLSVAQAYFAAAGTDELVVARQDAVKVATETFDVAKARVAAELANQVESTRAETALIRASQDLLEAETARSAAYRALVTALGIKEGVTVEGVKDLPAEPGAVDALVNDAHARRPEIAAEHATIAEAEANARAGAWRWSPTLSAFGRATLSNYAGFSGDKYSWAVGVALDWTVFDGGVRDSQRRIAEAQERAAEVQLEALGDVVSDEVANAHGSLATKRKGVAAAQRAVELARETLRLIRAQYEAGTAKQLDVLQAQDGLVSAEVSLAQAHFDVALADLQLKRAAGSFPGHVK